MSPPEIKLGPAPMTHCTVGIMAAIIYGLDRVRVASETPDPAVDCTPSMSHEDAVTAAWSLYKLVGKGPEDQT